MTVRSVEEMKRLHERVRTLLRQRTLSPTGSRGRRESLRRPFPLKKIWGEGGGEAGAEAGAEAEGEAGAGAEAETAVETTRRVRRTGSERRRAISRAAHPSRLRVRREVEQPQLRVGLCLNLHPQYIVQERERERERAPLVYSLVNLKPTTTNTKGSITMT